MGGTLGRTLQAETGARGAFAFDMSAMASITFEPALGKLRSNDGREYAVCAKIAEYAVSMPWYSPMSAVSDVSVVTSLLRKCIGNNANLFLKADF